MNNDIKTLLATTLVLGIGGGLLFYLKNNDSEDGTNNYDKDVNNPTKRSNKNKKPAVKKNNLDFDSDNNDNYDNYDDHQEYDEDETFINKDSPTKSKTRRNKKKLTMSKKRYY